MKKLHQDVERILINHDQIVRRCEELGEQLTKDYKGKDVVFVAILNGAVPFFAELIKHVDCDIMIDFLKASSYEGIESTGSIRITSDLKIDIKGKNVVIVEDIIDTGLTLDTIIKNFKQRGATSVEVVTLLNKKDARTVKILEPKYNGFDIPNEFVIGFGLDYNELYRNLPYVGVIKKSVYERN